MADDYGKAATDATEAGLTFDENSANLAIDFMAMGEAGEAFLKKVANWCVESFDEMWEGGEMYREYHARDWKLFAGQTPKKMSEYTNAPNGHVPLMLTNISRNYFSLQAELFADWTHIFNVLPVGPDDREIPKVLTRHGNWQFRVKITDFKRQSLAGLLQFLVHGDVVCHSYYDESKRRNCHEMLTPEQFVLPYLYVSRETDLSDVPCRAKVARMYKHDLRRYRGKWNDIDKVIKHKAPDPDETPDSPIRKGIADIQGHEVPTELKYGEYKIVWWEGWCELPAGADGVEQERFCQVVFDHESKHVLSMTVHEKEDWEDRRRYERQEAEMQAYGEARAAYDQNHDMLAQQKAQLEAQLSDPRMHPEDAAIMRQGLDAAQLPPEPPPPSWAEPDPDAEEDPMAPTPGAMKFLPPKPIRKVPIHMFSHGVCIEPLVGPVGLGHGRVQADLNRAANVALGQFQDAAALGNVGAYLTSGLEFEHGDPQVKPGAFIPVRLVTGGQLKDAFTELPNRPANPQLAQIIELMLQQAMVAMQSQDILSGAPGKSGETYRGHAARLEQANKQLGVTGQRFTDFYQQIIINNGDLNAVYLPDEEIFYVNDDRANTPDGELLKVGRKLYERDYRIEFRSDLRFSTQAQRVSEADELLSMPNAVPALQQNLAFQWHAAKGSLEARDAPPEMIAALGPMPPMPVTPMGVMMQAPPGAQGAPGQTPPPGADTPGAGGPSAPLAAQGAPMQGIEPPPQMQSVSDHGGPQAPQAPGNA